MKQGQGKPFGKKNGQHSKHDSHADHFAPRGNASTEWLACVHTPLPIPKALKIPEAKIALEKEWGKLGKKKAWDISKVAPRAKAIRDAKAAGRSVHFGSLMDLCHIKNSQMCKEFWSYKSRIVFRVTLLRMRMVNSQFSPNREHLRPTWPLRSLWMLLLAFGEDEVVIRLYFALGASSVNVGFQRNSGLQL